MSVLITRGAVLVVLVALLSCSACRGPVTAPPVPRQPMAMPLHPTAALVEDPALRPLVDAVAAQELVAPVPTARQGPTPEYAAFAELARRLGPALPALLGHQSAVVRTYA